MAGPNQNAILTELSSIFPQHSQQIITFIHNDVVNVYGQMADKTMILPSCIERLLELPDDFNVPTQEGNTIEQDMGVEAEIVEEMVGNDDRAILINSTINSTMNSTSTRIADVTGNSLTTTSSSNLSTNNTASTPSSSNHTTTSDDIDLDSMDTPLSSTSSENDNSFYRNKDIPRYREPVTISSGENSPVVAKDPNYFPADDIDEVLLLEDLSTDVSQVRPKILDDDDDVLEVSITVNRAKRKNENHESTPDAKKRKSSSDTSSTHNSSVNLSHVGGTIRTHVIVPNRLQDGAGPSNATSTPNAARAGPDFTAGIFKQIEENRNNLFKNIIGASTITRPPTATIGSSTFTRPPEQQPTPKAPTPIKVPETPPPPPPPVPAPAPPVLVDIANLKKGMKDFDHYAKKRVKDIINDVAVTHIERLIQQHPDQTPLEQVVTQ
ncbi:uncharacterized protein [Clytia hemisphaerica]|uniref:Uncharacterized protein n=1 Tax=Clytia hemisphaerica TaxID=252671 RepID=A0A7M5XAM5_9CNID